MRRLSKLQNYVALAILLYAIRTLAVYAAQMEWDAAWLTVALKTIASLSAFILAALLLTGLWHWGKRVAGWLLGLLDPGVETMAIEGAGEIKQSITNLSQTLADIEQDSSRASLMLLDAEQHAANLVALVKGVVLKAEAMKGEAEGLKVALAALADRDLTRMAQAAGSVKDPHIRELMLCRAQLDGSYWLDVTRLVATHLGTLEQWTASYDLFASDLLAEISGQKTRLAALTASLELVGTARPMLQLNAKLDEAQAYVQPQRRPELARSLKALPAINARLLR